MTDTISKLWRSFDPAGAHTGAQNLAEGAVRCGVAEAGCGGALSAAVKCAVDVDEAGDLSLAKAGGWRCGGRGKGGRG